MPGALAGLIVLDASVLASAIADDSPDGHLARSELLLAAGELAAPDLVDVETTAVLRNRWLAGTISEGRFALAIEDLGDLSIDRYPTLPPMRRAYKLRANVTAYVALAEVPNCELLTGDRRLANATGPGCKLRLLTAPSDWCSRS